MRIAVCADCGVEFEAGSRGRLAERCPVHRPIRHQAMREAIQARRIERPCRHPDGCARAASKNGWCSMHAYRIARYGDPGVASELKVEPKDRYQYDLGYVLVRIGRGRKGLRYEHHLVMERILGRPLLPHENVHHINGVRDDNRPENLELWSKAQPAGQRVTDKVAWAIELLDLYAPDLLAAKPVQLRLVE